MQHVRVDIGDGVRGADNRGRTKAEIMDIVGPAERNVTVLYI